MAAFKKGDVVQLKSGGPMMTVSDPEHVGQWGTKGVLCVYFDGNKKIEETFEVEVLQVAEY